MGNEIRENAIVKAAINAAKMMGGDKEKVDTAEEIKLFENIINANKAEFKSEEDYKKAFGLYQTNPVTKTETKETTWIRKRFKEDFAKMNKEGNYNQADLINSLEKAIDKIDDKKEKKAAKEELKYIEKTLVVKNARAYVKKAIESVLYTDKDTEGAIQDAAIQYLKDNNMWDKYTKALMSRALFKKDVFAKNPTEYTLSAKDSYGEALIEKQQLRNRVAAKKVQSDKDIKKMLNKGKNDYHLIADLEKAGLVTAVREDGTRDLSKLSQLIRDCLGYDLTRNPGDPGVKTSEEIETLRGNISNEFEKRCGFKREYNNRELFALIKLCGYDNDRIASLEKIAKGTLIGAAIGGLTGAISEMSKPKDIIKDGDLTFSNTVEVNIKGSNFENVDFGDYNGAVTYDEATGIVKIVIDEFIKIPGSTFEIGKQIGDAAIRSAMIGAVLGALSSVTPDKEIEIMPRTIAETESPEDYYNSAIKTNKQLSKSQKKEILNLINSLIDFNIKDETKRNEKWHDDFSALIDFLGGIRGRVNKNELDISQEDLEAFLKSRGIGEPVETDNDCDDNKCNAKVKRQFKNIPTKDLDNLIHETKYGDTWKGLVEAYYPGLVEKCGGLYGKNGAIKALQRALCTDKNGNFNATEFKNLINEKDLAKQIKMPKDVNGIKRVKGDVVKVDFKPEELADKNSQKVTAGYDQYTVKIRKVPNGWVATDDCTNLTASGSTKKEAIENLEKLTKKEYQNKDNLLKD